MSGLPSSHDTRPIRSVDVLVDWFRAGEKPRDAWRIGTEHEKIGVYRDGFARVPYEGPRGIGGLLAAIAERDGWEPVLEGPNVIGLLKDGASISLEPGGQIELSGAPLRTLRETCSEFRTHVELVKSVSERVGVTWLALGADPLHTVDEIPRVPKARYAIMREYLPTRGKLAMQMMHSTATVQANFDYASEADMAHKLRTAMGCSPIVSALFANSPLSQGRENGYASWRVAVWRETDPDRCGLLPFVFDADFGYRRYAEWALDVPMFFVVRDGRYRPALGTTFRDFVERGFEGEQATMQDWDLHLTTLFPEVRLKRFIEVRGADAAPGPFVCALPAVWKGILYDPIALDETWALVRDWSLEAREAALGAVARSGLHARLGDGAGVPALELGKELVAISARGLARIAQRGETDADEGGFLDPLREQLARGESPAHTLLERWRGEWGGSLPRLIEATSY